MKVNSTKREIAAAVLAYRYWRLLLKTAPVQANDRGNQLLRDKDADRALGTGHNQTDYSRYLYDDKLCRAGWKQYDTSQDAWYFGIWVDLAGRRIFTFAEGDPSLVVCPNDDHLRAEIESMNSFYGEPSPAWITISLIGKVTEYYDQRPQLQQHKTEEQPRSSPTLPTLVLDQTRRADSGNSL